MNEWIPLRESILSLCQELPDNNKARRSRQSLIEDCHEEYDLFPLEDVRENESFVTEIKLWFESNPEAEETFNQWSQ